MRNILLAFALVAVFGCGRLQKMARTLPSPGSPVGEESQNHDEHPHGDPTATGTVDTPTATDNTTTGDGSDPRIVEFRIKVNTGKQSAWNSKSEMLNVKVKDIIRFINDDSIDHAVHGGGDCPIDHSPSGQVIGPNQSRDFVVKRSNDPTSSTNSSCYRHDPGVSTPANSPFWVKAIN